MDILQRKVKIMMTRLVTEGRMMSATRCLTRIHDDASVFVFVFHHFLQLLREEEKFDKILEVNLTDKGERTYRMNPFSVGVQSKTLFRV